MRTLIGMLPAALLAVSFFEVSVFDNGFAAPVGILFLNLGSLRVGQFLTLVTEAFLFAVGLGAESLTWVLPSLIAPFSCIYYPTADTLPDWSAVSRGLYSNYLCFRRVCVQLLLDRSEFL